jgi:hypothetical protein
MGAHGRWSEAALYPFTLLSLNVQKAIPKIPKTRGIKKKYGG